MNHFACHLIPFAYTILSVLPPHLVWYLILPADCCNLVPLQCLSPPGFYCHFSLILFQTSHFGAKWLGSTVILPFLCYVLLRQMIMPLWAPGPQNDVERTGRHPKTQQCPTEDKGELSEATTHLHPLLHSSMRDSFSLAHCTSQVRGEMALRASGGVWI